VDFGTLPLLITLGVIILLFFLVRRRGGSVRQRPELVQSLIYEVRLNQVLVDTFHLREKPKSFESTQWQLYKDKLDFLEETFAKKCKDCGHEHENMVERCNRCGSENLRGRSRNDLRETLSDVFSRIEEYNVEIKAAKKARSTDFLNTDVSKLKTPLARSKKGLEDWLEENTGHRELPPKYPTMLGSLFGER